MALLNKFTPFASFVNGSPFSLTSRLGLKRPCHPSVFKSMASGWKSHSAQISIIKPMAQFASNAGQGPVIFEPSWRNTQGKHILWVDDLEYGLGEAILYPPDDDASM